MTSYDKIPVKDHKPNKHKNRSKVKYLKIKVIDDLESITINKEIAASINKKSSVHTDATNHIKIYLIN